MKNLKLVLCGFIYMFYLLASCFAGGEVPVSISNDGALLLKTNSNHNVLLIVDISRNKETLITRGLGAGYYASFSPDNQFVCFKQINQLPDGKRTHIPMLYDIKNNQFLPLAPPSPVAGTPTVSPDGKIAFTIGNQLTVLDSVGKTIFSADLGHHVNLLAFSPDGLCLAYNTPDEQIAILSLRDGTTKVISDGNASYWDPKFSPKGDKILYSSVSGKIFCVKLKNLSTKIIGKGMKPSWVDNETVAFCSKVSDERKVLNTELRIVNVNYSKKSSLLLIHNGDAELAIKGKRVAISASGKIKVAQISVGKERAELTSINTLEDSLTSQLLSDEIIYSEPLSENTVIISGVPTIHQVYDTPEWFNGSWACGATAAAMALAYYGCFNYWDCWCRDPYSHYSHYGPYICETYTYNGHTFNIIETDPNGEYATGGYGYITQNDWEDTKGHMAEYISFHGPSSGVDWAPTFAKACAEVDNSYPHVNLNSLTSAGHYITCIGYYTNQYTLIFNDPYGNKNTPGYPSYDGTAVSYDWPGYNYGNANLNTVHCYIYARWSIHPTPTPTPTPIAEVIVDNADPDCTLNGSWTLSTNVRGWYATNYAVSPMNSGSLATFTLNLPVAGNYDVYAWWTAASDRSLKAPYTVYYSGGSQTKTFDQRYWGGRWQYIGNYPFQAGQYSVRLSSNTGERGQTKYVIADAVRAVIPAGAPTPTPTPSPTPTPTPSGKVFVNDITMSWGKTGTNYYAKATVWIKNDSGGDVSGATVYGVWSGAVSASQSGTTGADGKVTFQSPNKKGGGTFIFTVTNVDAPGYTYDPTLNIETSDSITAP